MESSQGWVSDGAGEEHWFLGTLATVKASSPATAGVMSVVEFLHPPGFATPRHVHHRSHEAFFVLAGSIRGFCGDTVWEASAGALVWLPREVPHGYQVEEGPRVRTLAITLPGGFDRFVADVGVPATKHDLPEVFVMPDPEVLEAAALRDGQEILGPPARLPAPR